MDEQLLAWFSEHNIQVSPILDGKVRRFTPHDSNNEDGWYRGTWNYFQGQNYPTVSVGDWRRNGGEAELYYDGRKRSTKVFSKEEDAEFLRIQKQHEEDEKHAQEIAWKQAEEKAKLIYSKSKPARSDHPYLKRKKIETAYGTMVSEYGQLIIPVIGFDGVIKGLQFISQDGDKKFLPGSKTKGNFYRIQGKDESKIAVTEGFATGVTVHEATNYTTYIAFYAGNLMPVCMGLRKAFPEKKIVIFADNDQWTDGNPGLTKAIAAAKENRCVVLAPSFPNDLGIGLKPTDFNDLFCLGGMSEVKKQIEILKANASSEIACSERPNPSGADKVHEGYREDFKPAKLCDDGRRQVGDKSGEGGGGEEKPKKEKKKAIPQEEINRLGKEILDCRFKLFVSSEKTVLYNITNISKKEVGVCQNEEFLLMRLRQNLEERFGKAPDPGFVSRVYNSWRLCTTPIPEPKTFVWGDQDEWSFKKLDFTPTEGEYWAWYEFLERLSSKEDFMAFVWSIFEMKNRSRQFLYLYDPVGEGGKSTVLKVLGSVFGNSFTSLSNAMVSGGGNRWLMAQLYGKRFVAWADCKNPKFCMSETVRNITSGDSVPVEFKGQSTFNTEMYVKLIIGSNHKPQITSGGADTSRLVCIDVSENTSRKDDVDWAEKLSDELPHFLYACKLVYEEKCPKHGKIALDEISVLNTEEATSDIEAEFEAICMEKIEFKEGAKIEVNQWINFCREVLHGDNHKISNFKEYLMRHGAVFKRPIGSDGHRRLIGLNFTFRSLIPPKLF